SQDRNGAGADRPLHPLSRVGPRGGQPRSGKIDSHIVVRSELATQNLASGMARLLSAITTFLALAFGIVLWRNVGLHFISRRALVAEEPDAWRSRLLKPVGRSCSATSNTASRRPLL